MSEQTSGRDKSDQRPLRSLILFNVYMALWTAGTIISLSAFVYFVGTTTTLHAYIIWAATTLGAIFVSILVLAIADRRLSLSIDEMKDIFRESLTSIEAGIREYVEPSVIFNNDVDELRNSLLPVLKEFINSPSHELLILGADLLAPTPDRLNELRDSESLDPKLAALLNYGLAYMEIFNPASEKFVRRFIKLFEPDELKFRTPDFNKKFLDWLRNQATFIRTMPNYALINTPRAPAWGAPKSTILTEKTISEIFFTPDGATGGTILTSKKITSETRALLFDAYVSSMEAAPNPIRYSKAKIVEFDDYIKRVRSYVEGPASVEGQISNQKRATKSNRSKSSK